MEELFVRSPCKPKNDAFAMLAWQCRSFLKMSRNLVQSVYPNLGLNTKRKKQGNRSNSFHIWASNFAALDVAAMVTREAFELPACFTLLLRYYGTIILRNQYPVKCTAMVYVPHNTVRQIAQRQITTNFYI